MAKRLPENSADLWDARRRSTAKIKRRCSLIAPLTVNVVKSVEPRPTPRTWHTRPRRRSRHGRRRLAAYVENYLPVPKVRIIERARGEGEHSRGSSSI